LLFTDLDDPRTLERLRAVVALRSGFDLAEVDLKLRGMGELYGKTQHGHQFSVENLLNTELIGDAQNEAARLIERDPRLLGFPALRQELAEYSQVQLVGD
jgi:ATP-dependent DNA helicase RecG